jgi:murein DD-endopeptidase MepM/ murein hydrolase activator NlpD
MANAGMGGRFRALGERLFPPRDLILRTNHRVKYVTLSPRLQAATAGALLLAAAWFTFTTAETMLTNYRLSRLDAEREQAKSAYVALLGELANYYQQFGALTKSMQQNQKVMLGMFSQDGSAPLRDKAKAFESGLRDMASLNQTLTGDIADLKDRLGASEKTLTDNLTMLQDRLKLSEAEQQTIAQSRQRINDQLAAIESQVSGARQGSSAIEGTVAVLRNRLTDAERAHVASVAAQQQLTQQIAGLNEQLETVRSNKTQLEQQIQKLSQQVDNAGVDKVELEHQVAVLTGTVQTMTRLKQQLESQVAGLNDALEQTRAGTVYLSQQVAVAQQALASVVAERNAMRIVQRQLTDRVADLEARLAAVQASQKSLMASISERTKTNVGEMTKIIAMTGLDVDDLLSRVGEQQAGATAGAAGGPFVPAALTVAPGGAAGEGRTLLASAEVLDDQVERWQRLQLVLHSMPLSTPIDHFAFGSPFGWRTDPFNGRAALHEGLDLQGLLKTPVLSTAPGQVVFAGWSGSYGRMVEIDHGLGIHTRYAHLMQIDVEVGDTVDYRQEVGLLGSSGRSTGPHVHYEVRVDGRPLDPMNFIKAGKYMFKG